MEKTLQNTQNKHKKSLVMGESHKSWDMEKVQVRDIRINRREITREGPGWFRWTFQRRLKMDKGTSNQEVKRNLMELKDSSLGRKVHPKDPTHILLVPHLIIKIETLRSPGTHMTSDISRSSQEDSRWYDLTSQTHPPIQTTYLALCRVGQSTWSHLMEKI